MGEMKKNIFFVDGHIPTIVATIIALKFHKNEINILVNIQSQNPLIHERFATPGQGYKLGLSNLHEIGKWDDIIDISQERSINAMRETKDSILKRIKVLVYGDVCNVNEITEILDKKLEVEDHDLIYVSDNTVAWKFLKKKFIKVVVMEHGASSYRVKAKRSFIKTAIKTGVELFAGFIYDRVAHCKVKGRYLTDCGESGVFLDCDDKKLVVSYKSFCIKDEVQELIKNYLLRYEKMCPFDYEELEKINEISLKYDNVYVYSPAELIDLDAYGDFLAYQLEDKQIDKKKSFFIIKRHPRDKGEYLASFESLGYKSYELNGDINKYLPMEIILFFFKKSILFSSYSTSILYARCWLDRRVLFSDIQDASLRTCYLNEYKSLYKFFKS